MIISVNNRILAWLAVISIVTALFLSIQLIFRSPILYVAIFITLLFMLYGIWLIATGTRSRLIIGWCIVVVLAVVLSVLAYQLLLVEKDFRPLALLAICLVSYVIITNNLKEKYWLYKRTRNKKQVKITRSVRPVLIINPKSGGGRTIKAKIPQKAKRRGIEVYLTKNDDNITSVAEGFVEKGCDVLGVSGGDGTLGAVASVAIKNNLPLVVLPGGTRCHFARDIGLDPNKITDSLEGFRGIESKVDVGEINGRVFLNNASFGLYADIVDNKNYRDNKLKVTRTVLQDLVSGKKRPYSLKFIDNQKEQHTKAIQVLVGVNEYETMRLFDLGRRPNLNKGILQVNSIYKINDKMVRQLIATLTLKRFFTNTTPDHMEQWVCRSFVIDSNDKKIVVGVDGEREEYQCPVEIVVKPKALRILLPAEGMRNFPSTPFGKEIGSLLFRACFLGRI